MQRIDIRKEKTELRKCAKDYRINLNAVDKLLFEEKIRTNLFSLEQIKKAKTVLCYISTDIEVDTHKIINELIKMGKTVAVPRCVENTRNMEFYCISSLNQTEKGSFGVLEPIREKSVRLRDFRNTVCVVPGLAFDVMGYRLGYGKGYYDRFLSKFVGSKIGICFEKCIREKLPRGFFDVSSDVIVTEECVRNLNTNK